jgi:broad specificity phosphatase PhoE
MILHKKSTSCPQELLVIRHGESMQNVHNNQRILFPQLIKHVATRLGSPLAWNFTRSIDFVFGRNSRLPYADPDVPLSPAGIIQSVKLGYSLAAQNLLPDIIITSPYRRAVDTAAYLRRSCGDLDIPIIPYDFLREKEEGFFDGIPVNYLQHIFLQETKRFEELGFIAYHAPDRGKAKGESAYDHYKRVTEGLRSLLRKYVGMRIAIVAHGMTNMHIECYLSEIPLEQALAEKRYKMPNCSLTVYDCLENEEKYTKIQP